MTVSLSVVSRRPKRETPSISQALNQPVCLVESAGGGHVWSSGCLKSDGDRMLIHSSALVDPKTKEWVPCGRFTNWQPKVDHVVHLLHALKASFKTAALDAIKEEAAVNRQVWS